MQYLIYGEVCVRDAGADDEWTMGGQWVRDEMLLDGVEEAKLSSLLVLGEICGLILGEECREEEGAPCRNTSLSSRHSPVPPNLKNRAFRAAYPHGPHYPLIEYSQSTTISQMTSAKYFSSSLSPSYAPRTLAKCLRIA